MVLAHFPQRVTGVTVCPDFTFFVLGWHLACGWQAEYHVITVWLGMHRIFPSASLIPRKLLLDVASDFFELLSLTLQEKKKVMADFWPQFYAKVEEDYLILFILLCV